MIADNRLQDETSWDTVALKDILANLDTGELDLELTGFDLEEVETLMTQFNPVGEDTQPRLDEKAKVKCPECGYEFTP